MLITTEVNTADDENVILIQKYNVCEWDLFKGQKTNTKSPYIKLSWLTKL